MMIHWYQFVRYDSIHLLTVPLMPNFFSNLLRRISWSVVSSTANSSNSMRQVISCLFMALRMSAYTLSTDVSVLKCWWYADWVGFHKIVLCSICNYVWCCTYIPVSFEMKLRLETGLKFFSSMSRFAFLSSGLYKRFFCVFWACPLLGVIDWLWLLWNQWQMIVFLWEGL